MLTPLILTLSALLARPSAAPASVPSTPAPQVRIATHPILSAGFADETPSEPAPLPEPSDDELGTLFEKTDVEDDAIACFTLSPRGFAGGTPSLRSRIDYCVNRSPHFASFRSLLLRC